MSKQTCGQCECCTTWREKLAEAQEEVKRLYVANARLATFVGLAHVLRQRDEAVAALRSYSTDYARVIALLRECRPIVLAWNHDANSGRDYDALLARLDAALKDT